VQKKRADIPLLKQQIANEESKLTSPDLAGQEWYYGVKPGEREGSQKVAALRSQLGKAEESIATGQTKESFAGLFLGRFKMLLRMTGKRRTRLRMTIRT
jgi:hypothetical protein